MLKSLISVRKERVKKNEYIGSGLDHTILNKMRVLFNWNFSNILNYGVF